MEEEGGGGLGWKGMWGEERCCGEKKGGENGKMGIEKNGLIGILFCGVGEMG